MGKKKWKLMEGRKLMKEERKIEVGGKEEKRCRKKGRPY